jgi:adenylylsulfate kinase
MPDSPDHLFPTDHLLRSRSQREAFFRQRALAVWLYGLSGSGKTTLANALDRRLAADGFASVVLDGDNLRQGLSSGLGFSDADRLENIRRAAEAARLFIDAGLVTIGAFITPRRALRDLVRSIIGAADVIEVYLQAPYETCAARDPKGLYRRVATGAVPAFSGKDSVFEPPERADLVLDTAGASPEVCLERLCALVRPRIALPEPTALA